MKIIRCIARTVILFIVLLTTLRYSCNNGYTPEQLNCLCYYSQIGVLDGLLTEKYPVAYKSMVRDPMKPKIDWVHDQFNIGCSYLTDKIDENESLRQLVMGYKERSSIAINQVILRGKFLWNHLTNSYELDAKLGKIAEFWNTIKTSLIKYFVCSKSHIVSMIESFNEKYSNLTVSSSVASPLTISIDHTSSLDVRTETMESDFEDEDDTLTITSTIFKTVTSVSHQSSSQAISTNISDSSITNGTNIEDFSDDIVLKEQDIIQRQFDDWTNSIEKKVESIIRVFDKIVNETVIDLTNQTETALKPKFQRFLNKTETYFRNITSATKDIDCKMEIDPASGKALYFDKDGNAQLKAYIDRQYVRDIFHDLNQMNAEFVDLIDDELKLLMRKVNEKVEQIRGEYVDIYEEWGNVMVNEWSKRLVYADIVNGDTDENKSNDNWRHFLRVKEHIIQSRDDLLNHEVILDYVKTFIKRVDYSLKMLLKENGEYTYILRSKANLAFQKREKEETELKRLFEEEQLRQKEQKEEEEVLKRHLEEEILRQKKEEEELKGQLQQEEKNEEEPVDNQNDVEVFADSKEDATE